MINEAEKVCILCGAWYLYICMGGSEIPEERVFGESVMRLPTDCIQTDHMQHFKRFSAQYPNIWFLIYTSSKFYKVAESLLWINSYTHEKEAAEVGFTHWVGLGLAFQRKMFKWKEEKYFLPGNRIFKKSRKYIKDELFWRWTTGLVDNCCLVEFIENTEATLANHERGSQ